MSVRKDVYANTGRASARPASANGSSRPVSDGSAPTGFLDGSGPAGQLGYARISVGVAKGREQTLEPQLDRLLPECARVYTDVASGAKGRAERAGLRGLLAYARPGDVLVAVKLDRIARSLRELVNLSAELEERGIGLRILDQPFDTTTPGGRLLFAVIGAMAEFERDLIRERVLAGLAAARERGRVGGRPRALDARKAEQLRELMANGTSIATAARIVGVGRATVYRWLSATQTDS